MAAWLNGDNTKIVCVKSQQKFFSTSQNKIRKWALNDTRNNIQRHFLSDIILNDDDEDDDKYYHV